MLHISLIVMNILNQTESVVFLSLMFPFLSENSTIHSFFIITAVDVVPCDSR